MMYDMDDMMGAVGNMMGGNWWGMATFGWLFYLLVMLLVGLAIASLIKYLTKK